LSPTTLTPPSLKTGIIDCDTHFWQPQELWRSFIDPSMESAVLAYDSECDPLGKGKVDPAVEAKVKERRAIAAGDDPVERLHWMDSEGIYANVIYSNPSWFSYAADADLAAAGCRAINRWTASFADTDRDRLRPAMMLPVLFPDRALEEYRYARDELGLSVVFAAPTPHRERRWSDPTFDPLWGEIQDAGAVMTFHEFTRLGGQDLQLVARPGYQDNYAINYLCGHTVECQLAITDMIGGGALDRFPELKVGLVEGHVAWLPGWLALMDSLWPRISSKFATTEGTGSLKLKPTEYFRRQCFVVAFPDDAWIEEMARYVGPETITISSDFPHPNAVSRTPLRDVLSASHEGLDDEHRELFLNGNARRIFGLG
jgi:predicted TIM-barrel fold metal-dependent hydrolase